MYKKIYIKKHERGLWFRHGDRVGVLQPGAYRIPFWNLKRDTVSVYDTTRTAFEHPNLDVLLTSGLLRDQLHVVDLNDAQRAMSPFPRADVDRIARSYGTAYPRVLQTIVSHPAYSSPLGASCSVTRGEVLYAAREEMGVRLADVLLRRTEAGSAAHPGRDAVESAAALVAAEHGWDRARIAAEIALVDARFTMAPMS